MSSRKRIGIFIDTDAWGGAEAVVLTCCRALLESDFEPVLLGFNNEPLMRQCKALGIETCSLPALRAYKRFWALPLFIFCMARFLRRKKIAILHSHLYGPVTAGAMAAFVARIPHVGTLHDVYILKESRSRLPLLCLAQRLGTRIVTVSEDMRTACTQEGCLRRGHVEVIANGVPALRVSSQDRNSFRTKWRLASNDIVFLCVARFVPLKRHDLLLRAFAAMAKGTRAYLFLYGEGPTLPAIRNAIDQNGLGNRVFMPGHSDEIDQVLKGVDVFVLSSDTEGLSRSIIEAMSGSLPVIATDVGGNSELVRDGVNGLLVPAGNEMALAKAMSALASDEAMRQAMGIAGLERMKKHFGVDTMMASYYRIYADMLSG